MLAQLSGYMRHERHLDFIKSMSSAMLKINNDSRQNVINKVKVVEKVTHSRAARMVDTSCKFRPYDVVYLQGNFQQ